MSEVTEDVDSAKKCSCVKTLSYLTVPVSLISSFTFLYVYNASGLIHVESLYVWLPLLIFALGTCAYTSFRSCRLVLKREDDDEDSLSDRRDQASLLCIFSMCHIMPLLFTIQVGIHMADAKPAVYFVPLMIFPCLLVLVTMLLLCCSAAMEVMDRLYTALFCLFVSCWLATFIVIPMKMQGLLSCSWLMALIPSYIVDIVLLAALTAYLRKGIASKNGSTVAKSAASLSLYLALTVSKFIGIALEDKSIPNKLIWIYAPIYICAPLLLVSVPLICGLQACSKVIRERKAIYRVQNRDSWEDSKRVIHDAMSKVNFDRDRNNNSAPYSILPDEADIEKGALKKAFDAEYIEEGQSDSVSNALNAPLAKASGAGSHYGITGKAKDQKPQNPTSQSIEDFEHGKMMLEEAQSGEEIINAIKELQKLCMSNDGLRTRFYKQQLILVGQLKRSQQNNWTKEVALEFGALLRLWSGTFNTRRSNSIGVVCDEESIPGGRDGGLDIMSDEEENSSTMTGKALYVLKRLKRIGIEPQ